MTEYRDAFQRYIRSGNPAELRSMGEGAGSNGGFIVPEEFHAELAIQLKSYGVVFSDFNRFETAHGRSMYAPSAQYSGSGVLVSENPADAVSDVDRVYGRVEMGAYSIASGVHKVSWSLDMDSGFPMETVLAGFSGEMVGRGLSAYAASGTGSSQPMGVYAASGQSGGNQVSLTSATAVTINGTASTELTSHALSPASVLAMVKALDPAYWDGACWYMNVDTYAALCQVTDTNGQPLIRANGPRVLHGFPVKVANELSDLTASTVSGPVLANLGRGMWYRDAGFELLRLPGRYPDTGQTAFLGWCRADFQPRDVRAIVTCKAAAS